MMYDYSHMKLACVYANVLHKDVQKFQLTSADIRTGIQNMKEVYMPDPTSLAAGTLDVADYNDPAHRCAYLHKYAGIHTALVADMFRQVVDHNIKCFGEIIHKTGSLKICSLGGGPGSDIIGVVSVLHAAFGFFQIKATIIDFMIGWRQTFCSVIRELQHGNYDSLGECFSTQYFNSSYIEANLLGKMSDEVNQAVGSADLVTMIKFISASACKDTSAMIRKIFRALKPGSLVLYIDNAGGGFHQLVKKEAQAANLITIFGPLKHQHYKNESFNTKRFGYTPCLETKVSVHVWRKPRATEESRFREVDNAPFAQDQQIPLLAHQIHVIIANDTIRNPAAIYPGGGVFENNSNCPSAIRTFNHFQPPSKDTGRQLPQSNQSRRSRVLVDNHKIDPRRSRSRSRNSRQATQSVVRSQPTYRSGMQGNVETTRRNVPTSSPPDSEDCCSCCVIS